MGMSERNPERFRQLEILADRLSDLLGRVLLDDISKLLILPALEEYKKWKAGQIVSFSDRFTESLNEALVLERWRNEI